MDREPKIRGWLALAVLALLVGLLLGAGFGASRDEGAQTPVAPPPASSPAPPAEPSPDPPPTTPPVLRRADLLAVAARAAANYAAGLAYSPEQKALAGRRFELVAPFGCEGPTPSLSLDPAQASIDPKAGTLTFSAEPRDWTNTGWIREIIGDGEIEAAEGFWLPRPWQTGESCPVVRPPTPGEPPPTLAPPSVGVVQIHRSGASRLATRAGRPYRVTRKATEEELESRDVAAKFVLSGRLAAFSAGEVARCRSSSVDQWPVCLIGVQLDRVAVLSADGETMAEWLLPAPAPVPRQDDAPKARQ